MITTVLDSSFLEIQDDRDERENFIIYVIVVLYAINAQLFNFKLTQNGRYSFVENCINIRVIKRTGDKTFHAVGILNHV